MAGTKRTKIRKNDQVAIIAGRDKGRRGRGLEVAPVKGKVKVGDRPWGVLFVP